MVSREDEFLYGADARRLLELEEFIGPLLASAGWRELSAVGRGQIDLRTELLLSPRARPEGPSDDFLKGAIFGIKLILDTPQTIMQQAQELHAQRAEESE